MLIAEYMNIRNVYMYIENTGLIFSMIPLGILLYRQLIEIPPVASVVSVRLWTGMSVLGTVTESGAKISSSYLIELKIIITNSSNFIEYAL